MKRTSARSQPTMATIVALVVLLNASASIAASNNWTVNGDGTATNAKGQRVIVGADGLPGTADDNQIVNPAGAVLLKNARVAIDKTSAVYVPLGNGFNVYAGADQKLGTTDDIVQGFGHYPQSDVSGAKTDPLDWRILNIERGQALLATTVLIDSIKFNLNASDGNDWSKSNLRAWLNSSGGQNLSADTTGFYKAAFSESERKKIAPTKVSMNSKTPYQATDRNLGSYVFGPYTTIGTDTEDKVWALSGEEVFKYFGTSRFSDSRIAAGNLSNGYYLPSDYAKAKGVKINTGGNGQNYEGFGDAWTRSPGARADYGVFLGSMGSLNVGRAVDTVYGALPVISVDLQQ